MSQGDFIQLIGEHALGGNHQPFSKEFERLQKGLQAERQIFVKNDFHGHIADEEDLHGIGMQSLRV
jgi:hypothetical protein